MSLRYFLLIIAVTFLCLGTTQTSHAQYYFGELEVDGGWTIFDMGEEIRFEYRNNSFENVYLISQLLERREAHEWVAVRTFRRTRGVHPMPQPVREPRRQSVRQTIESGSTFEYYFPYERISEYDRMIPGRYRLVITLTSNPNHPDYARLYREVVIR